MEEWRQIGEFPDYSVSSDGRVRNDYNGRMMSLLVNQRGIINVGLTADRRQHKRSVALLVATEFLEPHKLEAFDTPIHIDGNKANCYVGNLAWRPRWYAVKYHLQFENRTMRFNSPVVDTETGEAYRDSWEAAVALGVLEKDLVLSIMNNTYVWPAYRTFKLIGEDIDT